MNNRLPESKLRVKDGDFVRNAVNVDISDAGSFSRRQGAVLGLGGVDCHSFWSCHDVGFFIDGSTLYRVVGSADALVKNAIATVTPGLRMSYCHTGLDIRASNGVQSFKISLAGVVSSWAVPTPRYRPLITAETGGALAGGIYRIVLSYTNADGEEGGTTQPLSATVPDNGKITLSGIPHEAGLITNVYVTPANGDMFFRAAQPTTAGLILSTTPDNGVRPIGLLLAPMPAGQIVRHLNGRTLVSNGNVLVYSEAHNPSLHNPARNYIYFSEPITMIEPCVNGVYISADQTYWVGGDIADAALNLLLPYRAIAGTSGAAPNKNLVWWMSERGMVTGDNTGAIKNMQEKDVAVTPALVGASLFREQNGTRQMIASLFSPQSTVVAASSYMDAEIVRKGTVL